MLATMFERTTQRIDTNMVMFEILIKNKMKMFPRCLALRRWPKFPCWAAPTPPSWPGQSVPDLLGRTWPTTPGWPNWLPTSTRSSPDQNSTKSVTDWPANQSLEAPWNSSCERSLPTALSWFFSAPLERQWWMGSTAAPNTLTKTPTLQNQV